MLPGRTDVGRWTKDHPSIAVVVNVNTSSSGTPHLWKDFTLKLVSFLLIRSVGIFNCIDQLRVLQNALLHQCTTQLLQRQQRLNPLPDPW